MSFSMSIILLNVLIGVLAESYNRGTCNPTPKNKLNRDPPTNPLWSGLDANRA